jgi:hypothetical protein
VPAQLFAVTSWCVILLRIGFHILARQPSDRGCCLPLVPRALQRRSHVGLWQLEPIAVMVIAASTVLIAVEQWVN